MHAGGTGRQVSVMLNVVLTIHAVDGSSCRRLVYVKR